MKFRFVGALASGIGLAVALTACSSTSAITPSSITPPTTSGPEVGPLAAGATITVSGQVKSLYANAKGFYIQVTKGCGTSRGLLNIHTNSSTIFPGSRPAVGKTAAVVGTGGCTMSGVTATSVTIGSASPSPSPTPTAPAPIAGGKVPPQGVYNACEIDTALTSMCEQEDAAIASDGFKWEINYIGIMATKSSLKQWFQYDASIGMGQVISIKSVINDPSNVLTGTSLVNFNGDTNLAKSCGATNNAQIISCIDSTAKSVPGFNFKWYIYDEPGCPNQSIGYCRGTLAGGNYGKVGTLASYIASIDPIHQIIGVQVGEMNNASEMYTWLLTSPMPVADSMTGFDHYPVPEGNQYGHIADIGTTASQLAAVIKSKGYSAQQWFVGQAFSWYQEGGAGCSSMTVCPYPTRAQMQAQRDTALYYAARAGAPMSMIFWYYWPDITCRGTVENYSGCNAAANRASLKAAAFAPFPTSPPSLR